MAYRDKLSVWQIIFDFRRFLRHESVWQIIFDFRRFLRHEKYNFAVKVNTFEAEYLQFVSCNIGRRATQKALV